MRHSKFKRWRCGAALLVALCAGSALVIGCGGGGSSIGGGGSVPTPTPTVASSNSVVVQLRDTAGSPVDGVVTLGTQRRATTSGSVSFANVASGAGTVSAEVNGRTYSQNFTATPGTVTVQVIINPSVTPTPVTTLPAPPPTPTPASATL